MDWPTDHCMLDWPEQTQTSPTSTSSRVISFLPLTVSLCGPPAGMGSRAEHPLAVVAGLGGLGLAGDGDGDFLAGVGPAPDAVGLVALKDHVGGEQGGQLDVSAGERWEPASGGRDRSKAGFGATSKAWHVSRLESSSELREKPRNPTRGQCKAG